MREAVQYFFILTETMNGGTVILLIQEKSGLLSVLYIHHVMHTVLHNLYFRVKRFADEALVTLHPLL